MALTAASSRVFYQSTFLRGTLQNLLAKPIRNTMIWKVSSMAVGVH